MPVKLGNIVARQTFRRCDNAGCGYFRASRKQRDNAGKLKIVVDAHKGIDVMSSPGNSVLAPISGIVTYIGKAYDVDYNYDAVHIENTDDSVKVIIAYMQSNLTQGVSVTKGQIIGSSQNLNAKFKGITNHLHLEVYVGGALQDPTNLFESPPVNDQVINDQQVDLTQQSQDDGSLDLTEVRPFMSTYNSPSISDLRSIPDFIDLEITDEELLSVKVQGITNHRRLYNNLSITQKRFYNNDDDSYNENVSYPITTGAEMYIPISAYNFPYTYTSNVTITQSIGAKYFPPLIKSLTNDPGYVPAERNRGLVNKNIHPQLTVWIWSRNRYINQLDNGWINVTKNVIMVDTDNDVSGVGGTFTLELAPVNAEVTEIKDSKDVIEYFAVGEVADGVTLAFSTQPNLYRTFADGELGTETIRKRMLYESILFTNDLVFISHEKLNIDGKLNPDSPGNAWYDFQGMVDIVEIDNVAESNDVRITIRGRDFSKAMLDDNSYFNPFSVGHINSLYGGNNGTRFLNGEFKELSTVLSRTIQQNVEFILHRIASIGYVPDDIFQGFENLTQATSFSDQIKPVKGIWQLFKVFIDDNIRQLKLVDDSISNPNGNILDLLQKTAQMPFVEFFGDTYGDKYYLIFRQPPFTQQAISDMNNSYSLADGDMQGIPDNRVNKYSEVSKQYSDTVKQSQSVDQKIELQLIEPQIDVLETLSSNITLSQFPGVINIEDLDVISDSLRYSNESYAWYKLTDRGNFAGQSVGLGEIQSIYFDSIAQIFGNKMMDVTCNYSDYKFFLSKNTDKDRNLYAEQASQLLSFMVETTIYLPFTRTGTITINRDRRIKKGQWIYFRPTKEYFYVDAVSHSSMIAKETIDASTTIQVSRGMYRRYIDGETVTDPLTGEQFSVSYFNLINLGQLKETVYDVVAGTDVSKKFDYKANVAVDERVLNFFVQKRQSIPTNSFAENGYQ